MRKNKAPGFFRAASPRFTRQVICGIALLSVSVGALAASKSDSRPTAAKPAAHTKVDPNQAATASQDLRDPVNLIEVMDPNSGANTIVQQAERWNRYLALTYSSAALGGAGNRALRVTMIDLQNVFPPNEKCCPPPDFSAFEADTCTADAAGCFRWVGSPEVAPEFADAPELGGFTGAQLQCTPHFRSDWATQGTVFVTGREVLPSSAYLVEVVNESLAVVGTVQLLQTSRWSDVVAPFSPPDVSSQPDFQDVSAIVDRFRGIAGAGPKVRAQLQPSWINMFSDVSFLDVSAAIDAFQGLAYPAAWSPVACAGASVCSHCLP